MSMSFFLSFLYVYAANIEFCTMQELYKTIDERCRAMDLTIKKNRLAALEFVILMTYIAPLRFMAIITIYSLV